MMATRTHLLFAFACLLALCVLTEAGRKGQRKAWKKKNGGSGCKYTRTDNFTECDPVTHTRNMTAVLKRGKTDKCAATKILVKACKKPDGCNYIRKGALWSDCDPATNRKLITLTLEDGADAGCSPTFINSRPCSRSGKKKWAKKAGRRGRKNKGKSKADRRAAKKAKRQQRRMNKASKSKDTN